LLVLDPGRVRLPLVVVAVVTVTGITVIGPAVENVLEGSDCVTPLSRNLA